MLPAVPDAPLPRIALVLAPDDPGARRGLAAFERVRREAAADLVLVEASARLERLATAALPEVVGAPAALRDALARARERRASGCVLSAGDARDLVRQGVVDAALFLAPPPGCPRLRVRRGVRGVDRAPGARVSLAGRLEPEAVAVTLGQATRALRGLGVGRPKLTALRADGAADEARALEAALAHARGREVEVAGPLPEAAAMLDRGDAVVAALEAHAELLLALLGAGPTTTLLLEPGVRLACAEPDDAAVAAALEHLARWSRAEGELVAARAPVVSVSRATAAQAGRCPFCRRGLDESPAGELLAPGPPVTCVKCGTSHHRDCLAEHGRCTLLGCDTTRVLRLGVTLPLHGLGPEAPSRHPFRDTSGAGADGGGTLRVEAPIDDPGARLDARRVRLELGGSSSRHQVRRGDVVEGYVTVSTARPLRVRGGLVRLRATLTTRDRADPATPPKVQVILEREAALVGDRPTGALGRLQDGVASFFGAAGGLTIPPGVRRWPFSFRLPSDHPGSVCNRRGSLEELVETTLEVVLDTDVASAALGVT